MRRTTAILSLLAALALPAALLAHEGHEKKVMGTVTKVQAEKVSQIEVKTMEGKTLMLTCNEHTKFMKGQAAASLKDVQVGARIVAAVSEEGNVIQASEVRIAESTAPAPQNPHQHQH